MTKVRAHFQDGRVVFDGPTPNWQNGLALDIQPRRNGAGVEGVEEDDIDEPEETPEEIEAWIREFLAIPPLVLTPAEEAEIEEWQRKVGEFNKEAVRRQFERGIEGAP